MHVAQQMLPVVKKLIPLNKLGKINQKEARIQTQNSWNIANSWNLCNGKMKKYYKINERFQAITLFWLFELSIKFVGCI